MKEAHFLILEFLFERNEQGAVRFFGDGRGRLGWGEKMEETFIKKTKTGLYYKILFMKNLHFSFNNNFFKKN